MADYALYRFGRALACAVVVAHPLAAQAQGEPSDLPDRFAPAVVAASGDPSAAAELLHALPSTLLPADLIELQQLDRNLDRATPQWTKTRAERRLARELLLKLARSGEIRSLGYVHQVFETVPWRRPDAARAIAEFAIAQRRRAADWRLLVRALPVVDDDDARAVLRALLKFPHRGTKPHWQREVILAGLRSGEEGGIEAAKLLRHWAATRMHDGEPTPASLAKWQAWFDERHPELPPPTLPVDSPTSRYKYADVLKMLRGERGANGNPQQGAAVFEKAQCIKCHRFGTRGEAMGPDLSNTQQWLQRKQFLEATMFPSQSITDQYETTTIITTGGQIFSGVLAAADGMIVVLQANGEKVHVNRDELDETVPNRKSAMPGGLLDPLSLDEIADLFAYLRNRQP